jgi:hypothetical protein
MMKSHNIFKRIQDLTDLEAIKEELESIDKDMTTNCLNAMKKVKRMIDNGWSITTTGDRSPWHFRELEKE